MDQRILRNVATAIITLVWFINGFFCKVLNLAPRHQEIVGRILGEQHAWLFTRTIGVSEILVAAWIMSGIKSRFCIIFQMAIIGAMNIIEFILAPDLLGCDRNQKQPFKTATKRLHHLLPFFPSIHHPSKLQAS